MIKKIFVYTILLFVAYAAVSYVWKPSGIIAQATWQDNLIKAQDVIYEDGIFDFENIIVGSSMSTRLVDDSLPNIYNLSFMGGSPFFGFELMKEKGYYPKRLFVETNFSGADNGRDESVFHQLDQPFFKFMRKYIPSLRESYQPFLIVGSKIEAQLLEQHLDYTDRNKFDGIFQTVSELGLYGVWGEEVAEADMDLSMEALMIGLAELESHGVKLYFYEMPFHSVLYDSPVVIGRRTAFLRNYPADKYEHMPCPVRGKYAPDDGLHLNGKDRFVFTAELRQWTDSIIDAENIREYSIEIANLDSLDKKN